MSLWYWEIAEVMLLSRMLSKDSFLAITSEFCWSDPAEHVFL